MNYVSDSFVCTSDNFVSNTFTAQILSKGVKFIPTPINKNCHKDILKGVDDLLRKYQWSFFPFFKKGAVARFFKKSDRFPPAHSVPASVLLRCAHIRRRISRLLGECKCCYPKDNLSYDERQELTRLRTDPNVITPVDKGGKWLVTPSNFYEAEGYRQLCNETFYEPLDKNIDVHVRKRLIILLSHLHASGFLSKREWMALQPPALIKSRTFYLLPKIHKSDWQFSAIPPCRPIVSDVSSVSRTCASLVEFFLAPLARRGKSYVRDSLHVISRLQDVKCPEESFLVTFDVASLYTNIPTEDGINAVKNAFIKFPDPRRPDLTILSMLRILLTNNNFIFGEERFLQVQGTAMGCAFGPSYANIFLAEWEEHVFLYHIKPLFWIRFLDDIFMIWNFDENALFTFRNFVNELSPTINVEMTFHKECIRFLDLELYKTVNTSNICFRIAFKLTDNHAILDPSSFHPPHIFPSILFAEIYRWMTRSSSYEDFKTVKRKIFPHWRRQGYTRTTLRNAVRKAFALTLQTPTLWRRGFFPCKNVPCKICSYATFIRSIVNNFDNNSYVILHDLDCSSCNVVYGIQCTSCKKMYVGQTSKALNVRISQHLSDIRCSRATPVAEHFRDCAGITYFSFFALEHVPNTQKRLAKENKWMDRLHTLHPDGINHQRNTLNKINLIVPFSHCSQVVSRFLHQAIDDMDICTAFKTNRNLRSLLRDRKVTP